jgi:polyisoprenyl-phosphate glycosyltransferase
MSKQLISVIVPVFNEQDNVRRSYDAITAEFARMEGVELELIYTDNHSTDATFDRLSELAHADQRVKVIRFARNFGFNRSILTGYRVARGDAAIQIDCDLEDPPSVFHDFIRLWRQGHDVVIGLRAQRREGRLMVALRKAFYRFLDRISETPQQTDAGDFRLVDRRILDQLRQIEDAQPYVRGLISELAYNQTGVTYQRNAREYGESKFPLRELVRLGLQGVYAHSTVPLRMATYIGIAIALATAALTGVYVLGRLFWPQEWPRGFATTTVLILFGISLNALFLGVIGEYVARIYQQVRLRPTVVVEKSLNVEAIGAVYREGPRHGLQ